MEETKTYTLNINGKEHTLSLARDIPLLWVLRDHLGLTGTKYGCGIGQCGACLVLVDNEAVFSCLMTTEQASNKTITTIEGLSAQGLHKVQQAWIQHEVPQCGYCQTGQIIMAVTLLEKNPPPDTKTINDNMSKVLCRCGTYHRVKLAINSLFNKDVSARND